MNILVTGGTGYIGSALVKELAKRKHKIRCLVREKSNTSELPGDIELWKGNLTSSETLKNITKGINAVFHLAAIGNINAVSYSHYRKYRKVNVEGTENLLKECLRHRPKRFIHFSSMVVEQNELELPYEKTKHESEQLCLEYWKEFGLPVVVLRPCMVWDWTERREFGKLINYVKSRIVPVIGNGNNRIPMASRGYVIRKSLECLKDRPGTIKPLIQETLTYNELVEKIANHYNVEHYVKFNIPVWLLYPFIWVEEYFAKELSFIPLLTTKRLRKISKEQR
jgi:nucleoside-diphosphate-sugar epimerase